MDEWWKSSPTVDDDSWYKSSPVIEAAPPKKLAPADTRSGGQIFGEGISKASPYQPAPKQFNPVQNGRQFSLGGGRGSETQEPAPDIMQVGPMKHVMDRTGTSTSIPGKLRPSSEPLETTVAQMKGAKGVAARAGLGFVKGVGFGSQPTPEDIAMKLSMPLLGGIGPVASTALGETFQAPETINAIKNRDWEALAASLAIGGIPGIVHGTAKGASALKRPAPSGPAEILQDFSRQQSAPSNPALETPTLSRPQDRIGAQKALPPPPSHNAFMVDAQGNAVSGNIGNIQNPEVIGSPNEIAQPQPSDHLQASNRPRTKPLQSPPSFTATHWLNGQPLMKTPNGYVNARGELVAPLNSMAVKPTGGYPPQTQKGPEVTKRPSTPVAPTVEVPPNETAPQGVTNEQATPHPVKMSMDDVLAQVGKEPIHPSEIAAKTNGDIQDINTNLMLGVVGGKLRMMPGGKYTAVESAVPETPSEVPTPAHMAGDFTKPFEEGIAQLNPGVEHAAEEKGARTEQRNLADEVIRVHQRLNDAAWTMTGRPENTSGGKMSFNEAQNIFQKYAGFVPKTTTDAWNARSDALEGLYSILGEEQKNILDRMRQSIETKGQTPPEEPPPPPEGGGNIPVEPTPPVTKGPENAVQVQKPDEGVLRQEGPQVGLQGVERGNTQPESTPEQGQTKTVLEKVNKRGFTPTQENYLVSQLQDAGNAMRTSGENSTVKIDVPDDGTFTVKTIQQANNLHAAMTGKAIPGMEYMKPDVGKFSGNVRGPWGTVENPTLTRPTPEKSLKGSPNDALPPATSNPPKGPTIKTKGKQSGAFDASIAEDVARALAHGAKLLADKTIDGAKWAAEMIKEFGPTIRPHLAKLYDDAKNAGSPVAATSPEDRFSSRMRDYVAAKGPQPEQKLNKAESTVALVKAGWLSSPRTIAKVLASHGVFLGAEEVAKAPASLMDALIATKTRQRTVLMPRPQDILSAGKEGATQGIKDAFLILRKGEAGAEEAGMKQIGRTGATLMADTKTSFGPIADAYINGISAAHGAAYRPFKQYAYTRALQDIMRIAKVKKATPDMEAQAVQAAAEGVFLNQNKIEGFIKNVKNVSGKGAPLVDLVAPFPKVSSNIVLKGLDYGLGVPTTLARTAARLGAKEAMTPAQQKQFSTTFGRGTVGLGLMYLGAKMAQNRMAMPPARDGKDAQQRMDAGIPAGASVQVGGRWYELSSLEPVGGLVATGIVLGSDSKNKPGQIFEETTREMPYEQTLNNLSKLKEPGGVTKFLGTTAGSLVPTVGADIAGQMDSNMRKKEGITDYVQNRIPGARQLLKPQAAKETNKLFDPFNSRPAYGPAPSASLNSGKSKTLPTTKRLRRGG